MKKFIYGVSFAFAFVFTAMAADVKMEPPKTSAAVPLSALQNLSLPNCSATAKSVSHLIFGPLDAQFVTF